MHVGRVKEQLFGDQSRRIAEVLTIVEDQQCSSIAERRAECSDVVGVGCRASRIKAGRLR